MKIFTRTLLGEEARNALKKGINAVYEPVAATMGARGRNAVFSDYPFPTVTNDGVSVARQIHPENKFERIGADLIKQAAERTNEEAGDGTTASIVLAYELISAGMKRIEGGESPMIVRKQLEWTSRSIVEEIQSIKKEVVGRSDIFNVAKISVEDDEMAEIVTDAVEKAGKYGIVAVQEGASYSIEKEEVKGYFWNRGYISPYMITNPDTNEAILEDVTVIVTDRYMNLTKDLMKCLNDIHQSGSKAVLIVADNVEGDLLATIIANKLNGSLPAVVVRRPPSLEELEDIAGLVDATAITKDKGIKQILFQHCGKAKRVVVSKDKTLLIADENRADVSKEFISKRIEYLKEELEKDKDNEVLRSRLAKLSDGIVVLKVGARSEADRKYRKDKIDDAVSATRAAIEEGIVEGAGAALYRIAEKLENPADIVEALKAPYRRILENAFIKPDGKFYNVLTGIESSDLIVEGIIDPAKVVRCAVENAISLASAFLTIESVTCQFEEEAPKPKTA